MGLSIAQVLIRGQPPKPEVLGKLRVACMELLHATISWKAFRRVASCPDSLVCLSFKHL